MKYDVIRDIDVLSIVDQVNAAIADGWKPLGGISVGQDGQYSQVVVQDEVAEKMIFDVVQPPVGQFDHNVVLPVESDLSKETDSADI